MNTRARVLEFLLRANTTIEDFSEVLGLSHVVVRRDLDARAKDTAMDASRLGLYAYALDQFGVVKRYRENRGKRLGLRTRQGDVTDDWQSASLLEWAQARAYRFRIKNSSIGDILTLARARGVSKETHAMALTISARATAALHTASVLENRITNGIVREAMALYLNKMRIMMLVRMFRVASRWRRDGWLFPSYGYGDLGQSDLPPALRRRRDTEASRLADARKAFALCQPVIRNLMRDRKRGAAPLSTGENLILFNIIDQSMGSDLTWPPPSPFRSH